MTKIDRSKPILVTGASGYIASWVVSYLLDEGFAVRGTVRDPSDVSRNAHLIEMGEASSGRLELVRADLLEPGSFDEAAKGCELVMHTASPFFIGKSKDPSKDLIEPAQSGTRNVLESVNKAPSVKRVVLTSSVAAIYGSARQLEAEGKKAFTENDWNTKSSLDYQPYSYSKTLAEREAWKMLEEQDRWGLVVINPAFVLGPSKTPRKDSASIDFMISMLNGKFRLGVPDLSFGIVDVRDVAKAHILAGFTPEASGRHITCSATRTMPEIAEILRNHLGKKYPIPKSVLPKLLLYLFGPLQGLSWEYIRNNVGYRLKFDNSYIKADLGMTFRTPEDTIREHANQLISEKLV